MTDSTVSAGGHISMVKPMPVHDSSGHTGNPSALLFLDIDGVLHPVSADYSFSSKFFSHLPLLEELLREFKSVDVVISSDWRLAESVEQLQRYFSADIQHRIIGATPQIDPHVTVHHRRQLEIQAWLDGNGRSTAERVALDDWPENFEAGFERLVLTDSKRAFDQDSFQELRSHFLRFAALQDGTESEGSSRDLFDLAAEVFGAEAQDWLDKPHELFDGQTPAAFAVGGGAGRVRSILIAIQHGGVV